MGAWCSRRRRNTEYPPPNIVYVPIMNPEQEPDEWSIVGIDEDEDVLWQIQSFDDTVSVSSSDEEPDVAAGHPPQMPELEYPNLRRGRLVMQGFRSSSSTMPPSATPSPSPQSSDTSDARRRFRRAMHRWQHTRLHITRLLRLRRIWSNLGRVMSQWPHSQRSDEAYRKLCAIWSALGRTLQRLNSRALTGHLCRRKGKLVRRH